MYWKCPKCGAKVDFTKSMGMLFEDSEAIFEPNHSVYHIIFCDNCDASWMMDIVPSEDNEREGK